MHDFLVWLITCSKKADIKQFRSSRISTLNMIKAGKFFITPLQGFQRFPCRALTVQRHQFHKFYENLIIKNHVGYVLTTQFWSTDAPPPLLTFMTIVVFWRAILIPMLLFWPFWLLLGLGWISGHFQYLIGYWILKLSGYPADFLCRISNVGQITGIKNQPDIRYSAKKYPVQPWLLLQNPVGSKHNVLYPAHFKSSTSMYKLDLIYIYITNN